MKTKLILLIAFIAFSFSAFAQPKIEIVGGDTHNWGTVTLKESPLKAAIQIKNVGTETLKISEVKPGCSCTTAPLDTNVLVPGQIVNLNVSLRIYGGSKDIIKSVRISSNDPKEPSKYLYLKATLFTPLELSQQYFAFGEMQVGYDYSNSIKLKNNTKDKITISDLTVEPNIIDLNLKGRYTLEPGEEYVLTAKVKPTKTGYFNSVVKFKTNLADTPSISITGYGSVKESIFNNSNPVNNDKDKPVDNTNSINADPVKPSSK